MRGREVGSRRERGRGREERQRGEGREKRQREKPAHAPISCFTLQQSRSDPGLMTGVRKAIQVSHMGGKNPVT